MLFARALASDAEVIFLDDPMRGVDVGTKNEVYRLIRAEADRGRCFIWYTTELEELSNCDHVYVFREGRAVTELDGEEIEPHRILQASFGGGAWLRPSDNTARLEIGDWARAFAARFKCGSRQSRSSRCSR